MFEYYNKWKRYSFKKRFLISAIFLFLCGFIPVFLDFIFLGRPLDYEVIPPNLLRLFYDSIIYGFIGILIAFFYSFTHRYKLTTALVILFVLLCVLYFIRFLISIIWLLFFSLNI